MIAPKRGERLHTRPTMRLDNRQQAQESHNYAWCSSLYDKQLDLTHLKFEVKAHNPNHPE